MAIALVQAMTSADVGLQSFLAHDEPLSAGRLKLDRGRMCEELEIKSLMRGSSPPFLENKHKNSGDYSQQHEAGSTTSSSSVCSANGFRPQRRRGSGTAARTPSLRQQQHADGHANNNNNSCGAVNGNVNGRQAPSRTPSTASTSLSSNGTARNAGLACRRGHHNAKQGVRPEPTEPTILVQRHTSAAPPTLAQSRTLQAEAGAEAACSKRLDECEEADGGGGGALRRCSDSDGSAQDADAEVCHALRRLNHNTTTTTNNNNSVCAAGPQRSVRPLHNNSSNNNNNDLHSLSSVHGPLLHSNSGEMPDEDGLLDEEVCCANDDFDRDGSHVNGTINGPHHRRRCSVHSLSPESVRALKMGAPNKTHVLNYIATTKTLCIKRAGTELQVTDSAGFPLLDVWQKSGCFSSTWVLESYGRTVLLLTDCSRSWRPWSLGANKAVSLEVSDEDGELLGHYQVGEPFILQNPDRSPVARFMGYESGDGRSMVFQCVLDCSGEEVGRLEARQSQLAQLRFGVLPGLSFPLKLLVLAAAVRIAAMPAPHPYPGQEQRPKRRSGKKKTCCSIV